MRYRWVKVRPPRPARALPTTFVSADPAECRGPVAAARCIFQRDAGICAKGRLIRDSQHIPATCGMQRAAKSNDKPWPEASQAAQSKVCFRHEKVQADPTSGWGCPGPDGAGDRWSCARGRGQSASCAFTRVRAGCVHPHPSCAGGSTRGARSRPCPASGSTRSVHAGPRCSDGATRTSCVHPHHPTASGSTGTGCVRSRPSCASASAGAHCPRLASRARGNHR